MCVQMKLKKGTYIITLRQSEDELWSHLTRDLRKSIKKAKRNGVTIHFGDKKETGYRLYREMCRKNLLIPMPKEVLFNNRQPIIARKGDTVVALILLRVSNNVPIISVNASDYEHRSLGANVLLYWETILYCKKKNYDKLDQGGVDLHASFNKGVDDFKKNWGGELIKQEQKVGSLEFLWWRYFRHIGLLRRVKYSLRRL